LLAFVLRQLPEIHGIAVVRRRASKRDAGGSAAYLHPVAR
jgi:hypothetical protein